MNSLKQLLARFFEQDTGNVPVRDWLLSLSPEDRKTIGDDIRTAEFGWLVGMPLCRSIKVQKGLWEIMARLEVAAVLSQTHIGIARAAGVIALALALAVSEPVQGLAASRGSGAMEIISVTGDVAVNGEPAMAGQALGASGVLEATGPAARLRIDLGLGGALLMRSGKALLSTGAESGVNTGGMPAGIDGTEPAETNARYLALKRGEILIALSEGPGATKRDIVLGSRDADLHLEHGLVMLRVADAATTISVCSGAMVLRAPGGREGGKLWEQRLFGPAVWVVEGKSAPRSLEMTEAERAELAEEFEDLARSMPAGCNGE